MLAKNAIWNWFANNNKLLDVSNMHEYNVKLQKLLFIATGLYESLYNKTLCNVKFEAWSEGPVDNEAYAQIKNNDRPSVDYKISQEDEDFLNKINNVFGIYSSSALSTMTHDFNSWKSAYKEENGKPLPHIQMDKNEIKKDFEVLKNNFEYFGDYMNDYNPWIVNEVTVLYSKSIDFDSIYSNYSEINQICTNEKRNNNFLIFIENNNGELSYEV
ncbi:MAG: DUF4065 domain-containing protein [Anaerorhabdus sp.]